MLTRISIKTVFVILLFLSLSACGPKVIQSSEKGATAAQLLELKDREKLIAVMETDKGTIELDLFTDKTPITVKNFVTLSVKGYYNGLIFHRVIPDFMIQGGDPGGTGEGGESIYGKYFDDEIATSLHFDEAGVLAMANKGPNTNGSQFFITTVPTPWLDRKHTIFGKVSSGMNVVFDISREKADAYERPVEKVVIEKIIIEKRAG